MFIELPDFIKKATVIVRNSQNYISFIRINTTKKCLKNLVY